MLTVPSGLFACCIPGFGEPGGSPLLRVNASSEQPVLPGCLLPVFFGGGTGRITLSSTALVGVTKVFYA